jgi:hypothetical protein
MAALSAFQVGMMAFSAVGTVVQTIGAMQQAQAQRAQANYQAAVARNNAITAQHTAAAIAERGKIAEADHRRKIIQAKGRAKTYQAASGFLVDDTEDSTNVQLIADIAELGELDILRIRDNVALEERRALIQGTNYQAQAGLFDAKAGSINPLMSGTSSLISGATATVGLGTKFGGGKTNSIFYTG